MSDDFMFMTGLGDSSIYLSGDELADLGLSSLGYVRLLSIELLPKPD